MRRHGQSIRREQCRNERPFVALTCPRPAWVRGLAVAGSRGDRGYVPLDLYRSNALPMVPVAPTFTSPWPLN